jgi:two-component system response regulator MprA
VDTRVLLVEDDLDLRDVLARALREEGFVVRTASDGRTALAGTDGIDAVVLDVGLPDSDGRDVCAAMRAQGLDVPVLFLTARDGVTDRVSGFSAGGDDYLAKPFHLAELVARLRAVLRRAGGKPVSSPIGLTLDPAAHVLRSGPSEVALSPTEFRLLACLLRSPGTVVRRRELVAAGWPVGAMVSENTLDQYVRKLRRRLDALGAGRLVTVRGVGYRIT